MSQVNNIIDNLSHNTSLIKEITGKGIADKAEIAIRETQNIAKDYLSKNASDAIKSSVTPQIKNAKPVSANATEMTMSKTADLIGGLVKSSESPQAFIDLMLYKPFYKAIVQLKGGFLPEQEGINLAFEIINKKDFPKQKKDTAIKFLSDLANKMKETEQRLIKDAKKNSYYKELLQVHQRDKAKYEEIADKMVNFGKLETNPFI